VIRGNVFADLAQQALGTDWHPPDDSLLFVCHQHLLPSVEPLIEYIASHLASPPNVFLLGKPYSTIAGVQDRLGSFGVQPQEHVASLRPGLYVESIVADIRALWARVEQRVKSVSCSKIIVLDEGGYLVSTAPNWLADKLVAVEQTAFRLGVDRSPVPVIGVATSAAKRYIESEIIASTAVSRLHDKGWLATGMTCGVVGAGFLGSAIIRELTGEGYQVIVYDSESEVTADLSPRGKRVGSTKEIIRECDLVFGCSGSDCLAGIDGYPRDMILVSMSSADVEFANLLVSRSVIREELHQDLVLQHNDSKLVIANGGFPYNFDGVSEHEPFQWMLLTRLLMLAAVSQALAAVKFGRPVAPILSPDVQLSVVELWAESLNGKRPKFNHDLLWWERNSAAGATYEG
jgi:hypothetical protein